jgi:hypothetical protein
MPRVCAHIDARLHAKASRDQAHSPRIFGMFVRMIGMNKGVNFPDHGRVYFTALYKSLRICVYFAI